MARRNRKNHPFNFFTVHYKGEPPYHDGSYVELSNGYSNIETAKEEAGEGDVIVEWERKNAWRVKESKPELSPAKTE